MTKKNLGIRIPPALKILPTLSTVARRDASIRIAETKSAVADRLRAETMAEAERWFGERRCKMYIFSDLSVFGALLQGGER
jgi:hypothetical protein